MTQEDIFFLSCQLHFCSELGIGIMKEQGVPASDTVTPRVRLSIRVRSIVIGALTRTNYLYALKDK
ncbi:hypothetical protein OUZ56_025405 [Daphnia magna]|uniref:Uncharacterized protein n=1 Tax=Daphnia magna TaxID=35525 RepID=A0ABQ9ZJS3_9CRUS|nr:hypothetical protein OUZ56_025405 [Daphnia magna]